MKMKALSVVVGAALGATAMQASADALLAPYFKQGPGYITTNYLMKTRGNGIPNARWDTDTYPGVEHRVHAFYIYKPDVNSGDITQWGWSKQEENCIKEDDWGKFSSWDMVAADVATGALYAGEKTSPPRFGQTGVEGFIIFQEEDKLGNLIGVEGDFSGFGYVFSVSAASAIDYKMLNNPTSQDGNDWSNTVVSKQIFDVSWWRESSVWTTWPTIVLGANMLTATSDIWGGAVELRPYPWPEGYLPNQGLVGQVYDRDEWAVSTPSKVKIVCAGTKKRSEMMTPDAYRKTNEGGWLRYLAVPINDSLCKPEQSDNWPCTISASGALMQKFEYFWPTGPLAWTIETSGGVYGNSGWGLSGFDCAFSPPGDPSCDPVVNAPY